MLVKCLVQQRWTDKQGVVHREDRECWKLVKADNAESYTVNDLLNDIAELAKVVDVGEAISEAESAEFDREVRAKKRDTVPLGRGLVRIINNGLSLSVREAKAVDQLTTAKYALLGMYVFSSGEVTPVAASEAMKSKKSQLDFWTKYRLAIRRWAEQNSIDTAGLDDDE